MVENLVTAAAGSRTTAMDDEPYPFTMELTENMTIHLPDTGISEAKLAALVAAVLGAREAELDALRKVAELARPLAGWKLSNDGETWTNRHSLELALAEYDTICGREPRMSEPPPAPFTSAERDMLNYLTKEDAMNPPGDL